jgi:hypothetical protein
MLMRIEDLKKRLKKIKKDPVCYEYPPITLKLPEDEWIDLEQTFDDWIDIKYD